MWAARAVLVVVGVALPVVASAQARTNDPDPAENAQYRKGTLAWSPALVFSSGHDTNVYREPVGFEDYETFVVPQIEGWWVHPGFAVKGRGAVEVVHFMNNVGATNTQVGVGIERRQSRIRPWFDYNRRRTNANPTGFEVGYKSLRLENDINGGVRFKFSPRTELQGFGRATKTGWDADAVYQGSILKQNLNRSTTAVGGAFAYAITPLTSVGAGVDYYKDEFRYAPSRDGETMIARAQVGFARPALIFGTAAVGIEKFTSKDSGAAAHNGLSVLTNIGYGSPDGTLIKFNMTRGTQYSVDQTLGYYVLTGTGVSAARRLGSRIDMAVFWNRFGMDYRPSGLEAALARVDIVNEIGGAAAYRVGRLSRFGFTVEKASKTGPWGYKAVRVVGFMTYGSGRFQRLDRPTPFER